jgi:membrane-bound serine protease (ClpP class)
VPAIPLRGMLPAVRRLLLVGTVLAALVGAGPAPAARPASTPEPVVVIKLDSDIDQISDGFLKSSLSQAAKERAALVVIEINSPGGLVDSMRNMVGYVMASPVPVVSYVSPAGARAASAASFIAVSAAYLAMAPTTNIGAAAVVGSGGQDLPATLGRKVTNDVAALMRSIAARRDRPVAPLVAMIRKASSYSAEEAVRLRVANAEPSSLGGLLRSLDGRRLEAAAGPVVVHTARAPVETLEQTLFERILRFLADPNLVFLLLSLGGLGLIVELWSGGSTWIPGSLGVLFLVLAFVGIGSLPFSWAGLILVLAGIAFLGIEIHAPGHLFFGATGTACLILGGLYLLGSSGPPQFGGAAVEVSRWLLFTVAVLAGLFVLWLANELHKSRRLRPYVSPVETGALVGSVGKVTVRLAPGGEVWAGGEPWQAELVDGGVLDPGREVRVERVEGFRLFVTPLVPSSEAPAGTAGGGTSAPGGGPPQAPPTTTPEERTDTGA